MRCPCRAPGRVARALVAVHHRGTRSLDRQLRRESGQLQLTAPVSAGSHTLSPPPTQHTGGAAVSTYFLPVTTGARSPRGVHPRRTTCSDPPCVAPADTVLTDTLQPTEEAHFRGRLLRGVKLQLPEDCAGAWQAGPLCCDCGPPLVTRTPAPPQAQCWPASRPRQHGAQRRASPP